MTATATPVVAQPNSDSATPIPAAAPATPVVAVPEGTQPVVVTPAAEPVAAVPVPIVLSVPEGAQSFVDEQDIAEFTAIAKRENWTNDDANAFVQEQAALRKGQFDKFLADAKAHAEIGGEHLEAAQQRAVSVLDRFLPATEPEGKMLRAGLTKTGFANYPPLIVLLARIGKAMGEDTPGAPGSAGGAVKTAESILYGAPKA